MNTHQRTTSPTTPHLTLNITRSARTAAPPTRTACEAAAALGLSLEDHHRTIAPAPPSLSLTLSPATITLITGPSGSGKSSLIADILRAVRATPAHAPTIINLARIHPPNRPAVDLMAEPNIHDAMRRLVACGLGEASLFTRRPSELSTGQRARLHLAIALRRADRARRAPSDPPSLLIADEFAAALDPLTAHHITLLLRRAVANRPHLCALIATPRAEVAAALPSVQRLDCTLTHTAFNPTTNTPHESIPTLSLIVTPPKPHTSTTHTARNTPAIPIRITQGAPSHYQSLAHHHYRAGPPATIVHTLIAHPADAPCSDDPIAILTISMPPLNAPWRAAAFNNRFSTPDKSINAARINNELRTISRIIVHPRYRALGIARALAAHYLRNPLTPHTECIAALGPASNFLQDAGMQRHPITPSRARARLTQLLADAGIEPWRLATPHATLQRTIRHTGRATLERELQRWANDSRATRRLAREPLHRLFPHAARTIAPTTAAFTHTHQSNNPHA